MSQLSDVEACEAPIRSEDKEVEDVAGLILQTSSWSSTVDGFCKVTAPGSSLISYEGTKRVSGGRLGSRSMSERRRRIGPVDACGGCVR